MITEGQILAKLDDYKLGSYCQFIDLGHPYSYLVDSRLNVFKDDNNKWAIVAERLGYNPRAGAISLDLYYFGNCLRNPEICNNQEVNHFSVYPVDSESLLNSLDEEGVNPDAKYWLVRGQQIPLCFDKEAFKNAGVELTEYELNKIIDEPDPISIQEMCRFLVIKHGNIFRATDAELKKSIPDELKKILVLDEWYHRDYIEIEQPEISDDHLKYTYEFNRNLGAGLHQVDFASFEAMFRQSEQNTKNFNQQQQRDNRPGSYETWQLLAKVIATGDTSYYQPTLAANNHWKYWPDAGSL